MKHNFKITTLSAAIMATFIAMPTYAAEEAEQLSEIEVRKAEREAKKQQAEIEVIEVTGFAGSLRKAMNAKRFSDGVSDSIHAEDVGKSTDQNIADALSRVTGVNVQEEGGEGARISVRGAGPSMNQISMNGITLTSGLSGDGSDPTADQSVDLSAFSSDILSSIDVVKTASADQEEGSLGASVRLNTVKPLNLNRPRRNVTVEGRYNDFSDENDFRINGSFADKYLDDTLGFVITASSDTQKTRQDRVQSGWVDGSIAIADLNDDSGRKATDLKTGKPIRVLGWQRDASGDLILDAEGNKQLNDISTLSNYNPDTEILHEGDLDVLARNNTAFSLNTDVRKRFSVSTGLQWQPTDDTDIQLDVTHTKQRIETDFHNFNLNFAPVTNNSGDVEDNVVDIANRTLTSSVSPRSAGGFNRSQGARDVTTNIISLAFEQGITDDLVMNISAGYSKTEDITDEFVSLSTATWGTTTRNLVDKVPEELQEPGGYDCSTVECTFVTGTTPALVDPFDGSITTATNRFNPLDLEANHLGALTFRDNEQIDTSKSLNVDFTWNLEILDFITGAKFGFKYSDREKDVFTQNRRVTNGTALIDRSNPDVSYATTGMNSIGVLDMMSGEAFPYDNFAENIVENRDNAFFAGWPMLDANKAIEQFAGREAGTVGIARNTGGSRNIQTETNAAYVRVDFEALDGALTGNVGLRYIKDKNEAAGVSGLTYYRNPHLLDPYNLLIERRLGDIEGSQPCPAAERGVDPATGNLDTRWAPANESELTNCWDWALTHGFDYTNAKTIPYVDGQWVLPGGVSTNRLTNIDYSGAVPVWTNNSLTPLPNTITDIDGNQVPTKTGTHLGFASNGVTWPYLDRSTSFTGPNGNQDSSNIREAVASGSAEHSLLLPSLNLNYAINDEMIGRFAISKTMTRPRFDSLNPRVSINENIWGLTANGQAGNSALKPLESKNLDLSFEWYFNEAGLFSVALFHKDMSNLEERVTTPFHYKDVRTQYELENGNLLLDYDAERLPGQLNEEGEKCSPRRYVGNSQASSWNIECHTANINTIVNGTGATIKGIELGYTQNYDFLPGQLSGLGLSINYTYQNSEKEEQEIGTTGFFTQPLPQTLTPEHSANSTLFWEKDGITLRLAHRYSGKQLVNDGLSGGAIWQDSTSRLDFSSSYKINDMFTVTFNATNLTDDTRRTYYTAYDTRNNNDEIVYDEGNVFDGGVTNERTVAVYRNGRQFRLGVRGTF
ncbi:TonB-dependent receptor [Colwellia sp. UCD-KL20]|uniref:TonB-dependent receptor n=1 Tax=Colwellia sp. UCD-KL20 TaxID=1917165 RepID=UPI0009708D92|nr:TonB-dependent receptor [Colwellia sp. UCD-KL20]